MLRRNLDAVAIGIVLFAMAVVSHIPPPPVAATEVIRIHNAVLRNHCPLFDRIRSRLR